MRNQGGKTKVSIGLVKEGVEDKNIFKNDYFKEYTFDKNISLYYLDSFEKTPKWCTHFFSSRLSEIQDYFKQESSKAVLCVHDEEIQQTFVITFGYGRSLINESILVNRFGMKIVLNTVKEDSFRRIQLSQLDKNSQMTNTQVPEKTNIAQFEVNPDSDFVQVISAVAEKDSCFGNTTISGNDYFYINTDRTLGDIQELLEICYHQYQSNEYQKLYGWIDNLVALKNKQIIDELDKQLCFALAKRSNGISITIPEMISWEEIEEIRINKINVDDVTMDALYQQLEMIDYNQYFDFLYKKNVSFYSNGSKVLSFPIYKCIVAELKDPSDSSILDYLVGGKWFKIKADFFEQIEQNYNLIPISPILCEGCFDISYDVTITNEDSCNHRIAHELQNDPAWELHKKMVQLKPGNSIEICDVFSKKYGLLFVKNGKKSSELSHLFLQATNACYMLSETTSNSACIEMLKRNNILLSYNDLQAKKAVVLGIMTNSKEVRPIIPFFSKISIKTFMDNITRLGYDVSLKNICYAKQKKDVKKDVDCHY